MGITPGNCGEFTPVKNITVRSDDKRWMNTEVRKLMRNRNIAYKKAKGRPRDVPTWEKHKDLARQMNEAVNRAKLFDKEDKLRWNK